jgi:hypothetical protein
MAECVSQNSYSGFSGPQYDFGIKKASRKRGLLGFGFGFFSKIKPGGLLAGSGLLWFLLVLQRFFRL